MERSGAEEKDVTGDEEGALGALGACRQGYGGRVRSVGRAEREEGPGLRLGEGLSRARLGGRGGNRRTSAWRGNRRGGRGSILGERRPAARRGWEPNRGRRGARSGPFPSPARGAGTGVGRPPPQRRLRRGRPAPARPTATPRPAATKPTRARRRGHPHPPPLLSPPPSPRRDSLAAPSSPSPPSPRRRPSSPQPAARLQAGQNVSLGSALDLSEGAPRGRRRGGAAADGTGRAGSGRQAPHAGPARLGAGTGRRGPALRGLRRHGQAPTSQRGAERQSLPALGSRSRSRHTGVRERRPRALGPGGVGDRSALGLEVNLVEPCRARGPFGTGPAREPLPRIRPSCQPGLAARPRRSGPTVEAGRSPLPKSRTGLLLCPQGKTGPPDALGSDVHSRGLRAVLARGWGSAVAPPVASLTVPFVRLRP